ncbi:Transmembrane protein 53 [Sparganum proliferum]
MIEGHDSAVYETPTTSMAEGRARVRKSRLVSMSGSVDQIGNHRHVKRSSDYKRIKRHIRSPAVIEYCQERRIIARQRNCICGEPVADRSAASLTQIIRKWVVPRSVIITDEWKGYSQLTTLGYTHFTVSTSMPLRHTGVG